jgi:putative membrane protein
MKDKTELAEERTDYAEDRTVLANERTLAGWLRTGLAAVGIGVGFNALFKEINPVWVPKAIATLIIVIGVFIFLTAAQRACRVVSRLTTHEVKTVGSSNAWLLSSLLSIASLALIVGIWLLA